MAQSIQRTQPGLPISNPTRRSLVLRVALALSLSLAPASILAVGASDRPEFAPIRELAMEVRDFDLDTFDGGSFNLRRYLDRHRVVIIGFVAGWCRNSNQNGHVIRRIYDRYRTEGLGVVIVSEYSTPDELRLHINRIGIDYPVVVETLSRSDRKKSRHYGYRRVAGDRRKWGTPFYVLLDRRDVEPENEEGLLARRVHVIAGEAIEDELARFIEDRIRP